MAASAHFDLVQKIYIAFYQRPADPAGLLYWAEQIDLAGGSADSMIDNFGKSPEAISLFGAITAANIDAAIESIYQAAFSRPADAAGKAYWVGQFNAGVVSPTAIALAIVQGAQNADQTVITNKLTVANNFTAQIDGHAATDPAFGIGPFAVTYTATDAANARTILAVVTDSPATILTPEQITEQIRANIADPTDPISIQTFTLTTAAASVDEGHSTEFTVTAAFAVTADTVLSYATSSTSASAADFAGATAGTVTILAGQTTGTFSVAIAADNVAELAESFTVTLKDSTGAVVGTPKTIDINDVIVDLTAPVLTPASLVGTYAENSAAGQEVADLAADDVAATFAFAAGSNTDGYFAIDAATGKVTLTEAGAAAAAANDFETTPADSTFTLGVTATDAAGNVSDAANLVLTLTNLDDDAPVVSAATSSATKIVIAFNEALSTTAGVPAASAFAGTQNASGTVSNLNITNVSITGSTVELTLGTAVATGATVAVTYTQPATAPLVDAAGNKVATFTGQAVTTDTTAPTLSSSSPADDATAVAVGSNIVLTFNETVKAGTGSITIVNSSNSSDTRTISVTDSTQVTISGSTVTINPTADLAASANYYVNVAAGAITDVIGNAFAGITTTSALNFSTPGATGTTGKTVALTQAADTVNTTTTSTAFQTGDGDDTINGFLDGGSATFSSLDVINGGGGTDTLTALGLTSAVDLTKVSNVENFAIQAITGPTTVDMSKTLGEAHVESINSSANLAYSKIGATTVDLAVSGGAAVTNAFGFASGLFAGTTDSIDLKLNTAISTVTITSDDTANIETLNINSTGGKSTLATLTAITGLKSVNVTGDAELNVEATAFANTVTKFDASGFTGKFLMDTTAGGDLSFTGGSGDDTIDMSTGLTLKDTLVGGNGTDTLVLGAAVAAADSVGVSGFERLAFDTTGLTQDADAFSAISTYGTDAAIAALTISNIKTGAMFDMKHSMTTLTTTLKTNGSSDSIVVNIGGASAVTVGSLDLDTRYESVTVNSVGDADNIVTAFGTVLANLNVGGTQKITLASTANITGVVDLTANSKNNVVTVTSTDSQTVSFGSGNDTLTASGVVANGKVQVINGGAGDDSLTAGAVAAGGSLTLNGEAGNDTINTASTIVDTALIFVDGGSGFDTITVEIADGNTVETIKSTAITAADSDLIVKFKTTVDKFDFNGTVKNDLATTITDQAGATLIAAIAADSDATVFNVTTSVTGSAATALTALAAATSSNVVSLYATFESALVSYLGGLTHTGLDTNLTSAETVLLTFDDGTNSVILKFNNATASGNTITADEIELVGIVKTAIIADGDFI